MRWLLLILIFSVFKLTNGIGDANDEDSDEENDRTNDEQNDQIVNEEDLGKHSVDIIPGIAYGSTWIILNKQWIMIPCGRATTVGGRSF